jgi:transcriptional regulator with XRE-family HTH domain
MKFFQQTLIPDPFGPVLVRARKAKRLSISQAARRAGISEEEALCLEEDRIPDGRMARVHAFSYARSLGIDPSEFLPSLPPAPSLVPNGTSYLSRMAQPQKNSDFFRLDQINRVLAPIGKAVILLLLLVSVLATWGMIRQLCQVRSISWITSSSRPSTFHNR